MDPPPQPPSLALSDRLRLVALEAGLSRFPVWMLATLYEAAGRLDALTGAEAWRDFPWPW